MMMMILFNRFVESVRIIVRALVGSLDSSLLSRLNVI